jgi:hypothetical protein
MAHLKKYKEIKNCDDVWLILHTTKQLIDHLQINRSYAPECRRCATFFVDRKYIGVIMNKKSFIKSGTTNNPSNNPRNPEIDPNKKNQPSRIPQNPNEIDEENPRKRENEKERNPHEREDQENRNNRR